MKRKDKGRLAPFVPLLITTIDSPAWKTMSHGAKSLYVALKRRVPRDRNRTFLSYRDAAAELRSSPRKIREWFKELEHYGFIALLQGGCLGVDGQGMAPHWRLTEKGATSKASAEGVFEPATNDFLKWDGTIFDPKPYRAKKQKPVTHGVHTPLPPGVTPPLPTGCTLKTESVSPGVHIGNGKGASHGVHITRLTTTGNPAGALSEPLSEGENLIRADDPRIVSLENWGRASQRRVWTKPTIVSDEPRDLSEFPADDMAA